MNRLVFLSYGSGPQPDEIAFAVLSAVRFDGAEPAAYRMVVVTDAPGRFAGLPVTLEAVSAEQMNAWRGPAGFGHRVKIEALRHATRDGAGKAIFVDSDVYFRRSPAELFDRIGPGRAIMHVMEGTVGHLHALGHYRHRLAALSLDLGPTMGRYDVGPDTHDWNAGVVGIDPADAPRLADVLALTDAIYAAVPSVVSEQLAFTLVLNRHTRLSPAIDVVFHYHQHFIRDAFRLGLPDLLRSTAHLPPAERAAAVYAHRPLPPLVKKLKAAFKRSLKPLGLFKHDLETSV